MIDSETLPQPQSDAPETKLEPSAQAASDAGPAQGVASAAPTEVEVKFAADAAGFSAALASPLLRGEGAAHPRKLVSIYFDTPGWDLKKRKMALRVRRSGRGAPVMTLKWPLQTAGDVFARGEIEVRAAKMEPDLALFDVRSRAKPARHHRRRSARSQIRDPDQPNQPPDRARRDPDRGRLRRRLDPRRRAGTAAARGRAGAEVWPAAGSPRFRGDGRRGAAAAARPRQQGGARVAFLPRQQAEAGQGQTRRPSRRFQPG